jgi:hypothetical protein
MQLNLVLKLFEVLLIRFSSYGTQESFQALIVTNCKSRLGFQMTRNLKIRRIGKNQLHSLSQFLIFFVTLALISLRT